MQEEEKGAKPYLLKDALDPRGAKAHVEASSDALELEGDGRGTDARKKEKGAKSKRRGLSSEEIWDWARVLSFVYIFVVSSITICVGLPPAWPLSGVILFEFWLVVYPVLKDKGVIRGGLW